MAIKLSKSYKHFIQTVNTRKTVAIDKERFIRHDLAEGLLFPKNRGLYAKLPDAFSSLLRVKLGNYLNINPELISVFAGADEIIEIIPRIFLDQEDTALVVVPIFDRLINVNAKVGGKIVYYFLKESSNFVLQDKDIKGIKSLAKEHQAKIIWLCSPNNPTGNIINVGYVKKIAQDNLESMIVVDECYQEYISLKPSDSVVSLINELNNIIVIRSFSKAFSIAGARVGYAVATKKVISYLNTFKTKFSVSVNAQILATKLLSKRKLTEMGHYLQSVNLLRADFETELKSISAIKFITGSVTNFILMKHVQKNLYDELLKQGILVSNRTNTIGLEGKGYARVSLSNNTSNKKLLEALKGIN